MKQLIYLLLPITFLLFACNSNNDTRESVTENASEVLTQFDALTFEGSLKAKKDIPVVIQLNKTSQNVSGKMLYKKVGKPIELTGTIDDVGTISLQESVDNEITGSYEGQIVDNIFTGIWKSANGERSFDFSMSISNSNFSGFIKEQKELFTQYTGLYEIKPAANQDADYHYMFEIEQTGEDSIKFLFYGNRGKPSYNMGSMEGNALLKDRFATYETDDNCKFKLTFSENGLKAEALNEEYDCGFGFGVYFEGDYIKTNSDKPDFENPMK